MIQRHLFNGDNVWIIIPDGNNTISVLTASALGFDNRLTVLLSGDNAEHIHCGNFFIIRTPGQAGHLIAVLRFGRKL